MEDKKYNAFIMCKDGGIIPIQMHDEPKELFKMKQPLNNLTTAFNGFSTTVTFARKDMQKLRLYMYKICVSTPKNIAMINRLKSLTKTNEHELRNK